MVSTLKNSMYAALTLILFLSVQSEADRNDDQAAAEDFKWLTNLSSSNQPGEPLHAKSSHGLAVAELGKDLLSSPTKKKNKLSPHLPAEFVNPNSQILVNHHKDNQGCVVRPFAQPFPRGPPQSLLAV